MNATAKKPESNHVAVSRAIDDVLAAERDLKTAVADATAAATAIRQQAREDGHRILARAEERIGAIHAKVAAATQAEVDRLRQSARADAQDTSLPAVDSRQLQMLAAELAAWLTTDDDG
ncbi:MAG: hypothetical protein KJO13_03760 [Gammaproteobacteria bacterium]|nr:hypothetical protein [Gammaproteobacteria bacterium]